MIKEFKNNTAHILFESARDITERERMEEVVQGNENKYKTLLENLPQKIFLKDRNSVYLSCNKNFAQDLKIEPDEIVGKTDYHFFPKKLAKKYRTDDKRIMKSGKTENIEEEYIQNRRKVFISTVKTPLKDEKDRTIGIIGIFWDITKQKKTEAELIQTQKLASLGQLAFGIAHEINNPLAIVKGNAQYMLKKIYQIALPKKFEKNEIKKECTAILEKIIEETERCGKIVSGLLKFSRKDKKKLFPININNVIVDTLSIIAHNFSLDKIKIIKKLKNNLPKIMGNANQLKQVFLNIILNAQQAMPKGGNLTVKSLYNKQNKNIEIIFTDTGCGIPKKNINGLFDPFFTTKKPGEGVGLGLSISHGVITAHKGTIKVKSKVGKGSSFTLKLPACSVK